MAKSQKDTPTKNQIDEDLVRKLSALLDETGLNEIEYGNDGLSVRVARHVAASQLVSTPMAPAAGATRATASTISEPPAEPDYSSHPGVVVAPMVGVAYTLPDPASPPFIQVGDEVSEGQTLFLIEAMKVYNPITSPRTGRVTRILVENETPVEYGEPLATIE